VITYVKGSAVYPVADGNKVIIHIVNNIGAWGSGFVLALSKRWKRPERFYRHVWNKEKILRLGDIQVVSVEHDTFVVNMIAQDGLPSRTNRHPLQYYALKSCLYQLKHRLVDSGQKYSIHCPKIGCGHGGGDWNTVGSILRDVFCNRFDITVYEL